MGQLLLLWSRINIFFSILKIDQVSVKTWQNWFFKNRFFFKSFIFFSIFRCTGSSLLPKKILHSAAHRLCICSSCALSAWCTGLVALQHVESSWTRDQTHVPFTGRQIFIHCTTSEVPKLTFLFCFPSPPFLACCWVGRLARGKHYQGEVKLHPAEFFVHFNLWQGNPLLFPILALWKSKEGPF